MPVFPGCQRVQVISFDRRLKTACSKTVPKLHTFLHLSGVQVAFPDMDYIGWCPARLLHLQRDRYLFRGMLCDFGFAHVPPVFPWCHIGRRIMKKVAAPPSCRLCGIFPDAGRRKPAPGAEKGGAKWKKEEWRHTRAMTVPKNHCKDVPP